MVQVFGFADKHRGAYSNSLRRAVCPFYCDVNGYQVQFMKVTLHNRTETLCRTVLFNIHRWIRLIE
jgi:hypothetical protein